MKENAGNRSFGASRRSEFEKPALARWASRRRRELVGVVRSDQSNHRRINCRCRTRSPASFKTQYALERSPRSSPMVSCPLTLLILLVPIALIFCIAGLLFFVLRARRTLGAYRIPRETGLLIPSKRGGNGAAKY